MFNDFYRIKKVVVTREDCFVHILCVEFVPTERWRYYGWESDSDDYQEVQDGVEALINLDTALGFFF